MRASDILGPSGALASAIAGYEHRPSQLAMADAVERAIANDGILLVEAGTGTGKTLAYLVPALLAGRKIVVSTGTKNLQDQIMEHDLPVLERHLGISVHAACMKGLANYLCLRRFEELRASPQAVEGNLARLLPTVERWRRETVHGDRTELSELAEDAPIWAQITSSTDTRIGPRCAHYEECFVTGMRRRAEEAQLVVVNHHLFFADLATRGPHGGGVLPSYDAVIFDEAHQVEDVATQFFGVQVSTARLERLARDAGRAMPGAKGELDPIVRSVLLAASEFFANLPRTVDSGRAPLPRDAFSDALGAAMLRLDTQLEALSTFARRQASEEGRSEAAHQIARRTEEIRRDLATVVDGGSVSQVAWVERRGRSASVGASPIDVKEILREHLFFRAGSVVLTSATLTTGGGFEFVKRRLGLGTDLAPEELSLPPAFDYPSQAALYVPEDLPEPRDPSYVDAATRTILDLLAITRGGAFVLCTSLRMMRELADRVRVAISHPVLVQGDAPKAALLDSFRRAGDAVLFASASFWEGVDVPGDALRLVIIDKLPFDVPTDPLVAARCERMREEGESPFMGYVLPAAALSLKQGFGRLIRTARDRGIVAILDTRLVRKGYGKVFLRSLPPARRCVSLDEVRAFWSAPAKAEVGS